MRVAGVTRSDGALELAASPYPMSLSLLAAVSGCHSAKRALTKMRRGLLTVFVTVLVLASIASASQHDTARSLRRRARKERKHHPEPDRSKPQRKFRGGRVRHPMFEGSGCPESSVQLVNASDTTSFALSALFSQFQAQTTGNDLRDRKSCTITVVLEPEANMSIGVAHVDFRGNAYVPIATSIADSAGTSTAQPFARMQAAYKVTGARREPILDRTYDAGYDDFVYENVEVDPVVWTPCDASRGGGRVFEFRIKATITAVKAAAEDSDVSIAVDTSDSTLQKGLYYQLTTRPCVEANATVTVPPTPTEASTELPTESAMDTGTESPTEMSTERPVAGTVGPNCS